MNKIFIYALYFHDDVFSCVFSSLYFKYIWVSEPGWYSDFIHPGFHGSGETDSLEYARSVSNLVKDVYVM